MRILYPLLLAAALSFQAHASPALQGTWSAGNVNGRPLVVQFDAGGAGVINGQPMRWQALGAMLFIEQNGQVGTYSFQVQDGKLAVSGGDLAGVATLTRGTAAAGSSSASGATSRSSPPATAATPRAWSASSSTPTAATPTATRAA